MASIRPLYIIEEMVQREHTKKLSTCRLIGKQYRDTDYGLRVQRETVQTYRRKSSTTFMIMGTKEWVHKSGTDRKGAEGRGTESGGGAGKVQLNFKGRG